MCLPMIRSTFGDRRFTAIIPRSITPGSASASDSASTSASVSAIGEVGAVGDGARAGSAIPYSSTTTSSVAMDTAITTMVVLGGDRYGPMIRAIALEFLTGTIRWLRGSVGRRVLTGIRSRQERDHGSVQHHMRTVRGDALRDAAESMETEP